MKIIFAVSITMAIYEGQKGNIIYLLLLLLSHKGFNSKFYNLKSLRSFKS